MVQTFQQNSKIVDSKKRVCFRKLVKRFNVALNVKNIQAMPLKMSLKSKAFKLGMILYTIQRQRTKIQKLLNRTNYTIIVEDLFSLIVVPLFIFFPYFYFFLVMEYIGITMIQDFWR
eukprot:TRINITY_DN1572_c0_g1_i7.p3 TRINITY_DN1572_c0_g1~~TRINITY_DN1572_c0_g1_i7.p3  ORF type:complete len:117 (+),score=0.18 TRINITY_DN1572_c0_g1_i7:3-353(+)